ncbi:MAG: DUF167 domain-containing protein [Burkholderiales bacterium]|nr:DUF167 domain-containing protein [Burkholderiales bacterium]
MYIRVKAFPNSKKEIFKKMNEDHFEISVKEKAERNMANDKIVELLSFHYVIPKNKIRIINGHKSPTKLLVVDKD